MANLACRDLAISLEFQCDIVNQNHYKHIDGKGDQAPSYAAIILPPSLQSDYYLAPEQILMAWLHHHHQRGAVLTSACAGAFILAATGCLDNKAVTTHWGLADLFKQQYPQHHLSVEQILINQGDVITAGGMMSWLDLGFELVAQFSNPSVMRMVGKMLVVDTGAREQRYYQQFSPNYQHGDEAIVAIQHEINDSYSQSLSVSALAKQVNLTERTFLRRFVKATGIKPTQYIQRVRIQKVCDMLESTNHSFEWIANQVGYDDASACRKVFFRTMGLTPGDFRKRFSASR